MNTANKDKGNFFFVFMTLAHTGRNSFTPVLNRSFRCRWVVRYLTLQPLFHQTKNSWYHWMWGRVGPWTSL